MTLSRFPDEELDARAEALLAPLRRVRPAVRATRPRAVGLRVAVALGVTAAVAATLVALVPRTGRSFTDRALAAVGTAPVVRVVSEQPAEHSSVVDLETGSERVTIRKVETTYDADAGTMGFATFVDGTFVGYASGTPDPVVARFARGFRGALEDGAATRLGSATLFGRNVELLRVNDSDGRTQDVAIDPTDYHAVAARSTGSRVWARLTHVESISRGEAEARVGSFPHPVDARGEATAVRELEPGEVPPAAGVFPGAEVAGLPLRRIVLQRLTTRTPSGVRVGAGLAVEYGGGREWVEISESRDWHAAHEFFGPQLAADGPLPPPGSARVSCVCGETRPVWTAQLRVGGVYARVRAPSRAHAVDAARAVASAAR